MARGKLSLGRRRQDGVLRMVRWNFNIPPDAARDFVADMRSYHRRERRPPARPDRGTASAAPQRSSAAEVETNDALRGRGSIQVNEGAVLSDAPVDLDTGQRNESWLAVSNQPAALSATAIGITCSRSNRPARTILTPLVHFYIR
jgi:hypothetical protein